MADYARDANAACSAAAREARAIPQPRGDSAAAVSAYAAAVLPIARERLEAFRELQPTEEAERFHDRLLVEQERFVAAIETVEDAAGRDDRATAERASAEGARAAGRSRLLFRTLEVNACAASPF